MYTPGMPTYGFFPVYGKDYGDIILGETVPLDASGNPVNFTDNWYSVKIYMNTSTSAFSEASNATLAAKKTFIHEVGHALKLRHPAQNKLLSGHSYRNGKPQAVMNQDFPNGKETASTVANHDRENLKAKWGA